MAANKPAMTKKMWTSVFLFGFFGQVAWVLENMYFNVFMDRTVTTNPTAISWMVALSAITATVATLIGGIWSDKVGKRKPFISIGYIVWGVSVMAFALISTKNTAKLMPNANYNTVVVMTVAVIVFMDCVMSYIGSTANDSAFNAWVTDVTDTTNRGKAEGVLAVMPVIAMAFVFGAFDWMTADTYRYTDGSTGAVFKMGETVEKIGTGNWVLFFLLLGGLTAIMGIVGLFAIKDSPALRPKLEMTFKDIIYGFRWKVVEHNKALYLNYIALCVVGIANMTYLPYLIIYAERTLGFSNYIIPVAIIIFTAGLASVLFGRQIDKYDKRKFLFVTWGIYLAGAIAMMLTSPMCFKNTSTPLWLLCISGFVLMTGNLTMTAIFTSSVRDLTPPNKVGLFQGIRMFFCVLLPMCTGPSITAFITKRSETMGTDWYGYTIYKYPPTMFLAASIISILILIPIIWLKKLPAEQMVAHEEITNDCLVEEPTENAAV